MAQIQFTDNAVTTLATSINAAATQLSVAAGTGSLLPSVSSGSGYFIISLEDAAGNHEYIYCEDRSSDLCGSGGYPLVRGYGGTTARAWTAGDTVDVRWGTAALSAVRAEDAKRAVGMLSVATTGGTTTLTAEQAFNAVFKATGTLVSNATFEVPAASKVFTVWNATSGAYSLTAKTPLGTGVTVPQGKLVQLLCDGTDVTYLTTALPGSAVLTTPDIGAATGTSLTLTGALTAEGLIGEAVDNGIVEGRLTLESGVPVSTTDQSAKTTVYFTPYKGNRVALYYSGKWRLATFTEKSVAVPSNTNTPFDIFAYWNGSAVALEAVAWTNDSTRATAITTQDGVEVKSGATDRRKLGSCRTTGVSGQAEHTEANRTLDNDYNKVVQKLKKVDTTPSWSYTTTAWRSMNNSTSNRVGVMVSRVGTVVDLTNNQLVSTGGSCYVGIDVDGTTTGTDADVIAAFESAARVEGASVLKHVPAVGYHYYQAVEYGGTTGTFHGAYGITAGHGLTGTVLM